MGQQKKYTAKKLEKAINRYFASITRPKVKTEPIPTGDYDKYGHPITREVPIINGLGEPVTVTEYAHPPSVGGLCDYLGIHHSTWADYCDPDKNPDMQACTSAAKQRIHDYLNEQMLLRTGKDTRGVEFLLTMEEQRRAQREAAQETQEEVRIVIDV